MDYDYSEVWGDLDADEPNYPDEYMALVEKKMSEYRGDPLLKELYRLSLTGQSTVTLFEKFDYANQYFLSDASPLHPKIGYIVKVTKPYNTEITESGLISYTIKQGIHTFRITRYPYLREYRAANYLKTQDLNTRLRASYFESNLYTENKNYLEVEYGLAPFQTTRYFYIEVYEYRVKMQKVWFQHRDPDKGFWCRRATSLVRKLPKTLQREVYAGVCFEAAGYYSELAKAESREDSH
jgi:hypothetical protein